MKTITVPAATYRNTQRRLNAQGCTVVSSFPTPMGDIRCTVSGPEAVLAAL